MQRKETYGTTGTRMTVRVFGGWDFAADDLRRPDFAAQGYARGVPMGGDLAAAPRGKAPALVIRALRDPDGANLDRIQVIKGWLDGKGETHERVYDVALSDGRAVGADGKVPPVGNTVDVPNAAYANTIGAAQLSAFWKDPDFDPKASAFYYVRVIEIPTPRWTAYEAKRFNITMDAKVPMTTQERAYTSPIWYSPEVLTRARVVRVKLLREPLLHFFVLGVAVFALASFVREQPARRAGPHRRHAGTDRAPGRRIRAHMAASANGLGA